MSASRLLPALPISANAKIYLPPCVTHLHPRSALKVICYFSFGTYEPWRKEADKVGPSYGTGFRVLFWGDGGSCVLRIFAQLGVAAQPRSTVRPMDDPLWEAGDSCRQKTAMKPGRRQAGGKPGNCASLS